MLGEVRVFQRSFPVTGSRFKRPSLHSDTWFVFVGLPGRIARCVSSAVVAISHAMRSGAITIRRDEQTHRSFALAADHHAETLHEMIVVWDDARRLIAEARHLIAEHQALRYLARIQRQSRLVERRVH